MSIPAAILIVISAALVALRVGGVTHIAFQAAAHLFVGGLIGVQIVLRCLKNHLYPDAFPAVRWWFFYLLFLAVTLSVVELIAFFVLFPR